VDFTYDEIAAMIDHSLLNPALTAEDLERGYRLAIEYRVATVCIMPYFLPRCVRLLEGSGVKPTTTVGFPHGAHASATKLAEARRALDDGAEELDVVINISQARSANWAYVRDDIAPIIQLAHERGKLVKVIFENCYLDDDQKIRLCQICGELRADWAKTSTGYGTGGATDHDLRLMRKHSPPHVQVKAAGGVRTLDRLLEVNALGVTRVGASRTADILDECRRRLAGS